MKTRDELIRSIRPNAGNFQYILQTNLINGSLYSDIGRIMDEYLLEFIKYTELSTDPEFELEYFKNWLNKQKT